MSLAEKIISALATADVSSSELQSLQQACLQKLNELEERMKLIHPERPFGGVGAEYQRVLLEGSVEDLTMLQFEFKTVDIEIQQFRARERALREAIQRAVKRETLAKLPEIHEAMQLKLLAAERARDELAKTMSELNGAYEVFTASRTRVGHGNAMAASRTIAQGLQSLQAWGQLLNLHAFVLPQFLRDRALGLKADDFAD